MKTNKYEIKVTSQFKKDLKIIQKRRLNIQLLDEVVQMLANDIPLPSKYRNHLLEPKEIRLWVCHVKPNWLLEYKKNNETLILVLTRTGSHSDLFE